VARWWSANRDEADFGDPDAYPAEHNKPHNLVCCDGIHARPERPMATMELVVAVRSLLPATPATPATPGT
jgi:cytochrome P450